MSGSPRWQAVGRQRPHAIETVGGAHFELSRDSDEVAGCGTWVSALREIHSDPPGGRQTHWGSPVGRWGSPQKVLLGWFPTHGWSRRAWMFYLFSKSNFSPFLPPFTHPASSPLPFLDSVFPLLVCPSLLFVSPSLGAHSPISLWCSSPFTQKGG